MAVVDNFNNSLSTNDESGSFSAVANSRLAAQRNMEIYLAGKVRKMLTDVLGPDQVSVHVSADIDHDQVTHSSKDFDPNRSATNSYTKNVELSGTAVPSPGGVVGTPANTNVSDANGTGGGLANNNRDKREEIYGIDNSSSTTNTVKASGELRRLTAAVVVRQGTAARTPEQMSVLTNMVKNSLGAHIGTDGLRDDVISVDENGIQPRPCDEGGRADGIGRHQDFDR